MNSFCEMAEEKNSLQKLFYKTTNSPIIHMTSIYFKAKLTMIQCVFKLILNSHPLTSEFIRLIGFNCL